MTELRLEYDALQSKCYSTFHTLLRTLPSDGKVIFFDGDKNSIDELDNASVDGVLPLIPFTIESDGSQSFEYVLEVNAGGFMKTVKQDDLTSHKERKFSDINDLYYMMSMCEEIETNMK